MAIVGTILGITALAGGGRIVPTAEAEDDNQNPTDTFDIPSRNNYLRDDSSDEEENDDGCFGVVVENGRYFGFFLGGGSFFIRIGSIVGVIHQWAPVSSGGWMDSLLPPNSTIAVSRMLLLSC